MKYLDNTGLSYLWSKIKTHIDTKVGAIIPYGTCSTGASTVAKTVTVDSNSFTLKTGACVRVKFSNTNSASSPTLNVNGTGAKAIKRYGTTAVSTSANSSWSAGSVVELTYDGTYWVINNFLNTTYSSMTVDEYETGTGTTGRTISPERLKGAIEYWVSDSDTTYAIATGDSNGQIKVTPSSGSAYNVSVKGLSDGAYKNVTTTVTSNNTSLVTSGAVYSAINDATGFVRASASARGSASSLSLSASTITKVTLDTWITQTDTAFTFSDGGIKCPYDGVVVVSGSVYLNTSYNVSGGCYVKKGTAEVTSQYMGGISGGISSGMVTLQVSAGDIIYLNARASSATTTIPNNNATHLDISYIQ